MRHATATILLEEGVPVRVVSELLGHSSTRITEDVYSHVTARLAEEAARALDWAL
jgi:site-specific recombinase XerD